MKIYAGGVGAVVSKIGLIIGTGATLHFRHTPYSGPYKKLLIVNIFEAGTNNNSSAQIIGKIETKWFNVDFSKKQISSVNNFVGKEGLLSLNGLVIASGQMRIKFDIIDKDDNVINLINKVNIPTNGPINFMFKSLNSHGKIQDKTDGCWDYT